MAFNYPGSRIPAQQAYPNVQYRPGLPSHFQQENTPSNYGVNPVHNIPPEQPGRFQPAQPGVPQQRIPSANLSGPQIILAPQQPVLQENIVVPPDSYLLYSAEKETLISNLKMTIKSQQDRIKRLESERHLLSSRLQIVQNRLEPHSKWNPKYIPELDRLISELKQNTNPQTQIHNINAILTHCETLSTVLHQIFSNSNLHSSAPNPNLVPQQPNYVYADPTPQRQIVPQQNQVFISNAPPGLYPGQPHMAPLTRPPIQILDIEPYSSQK